MSTASEAHFDQGDLGSVSMSAASTATDAAAGASSPRNAEAGSVGQRIKSGLSWTFLGSVTARLLGACSGILLARILGPDGFGQYGIVLSTVAMFSVYGGFRLANTSIKYVSEYRLRDPERAARVLKLSLAVSLVLCGLVGLVVSGFAPFFAEKMFDRPELAGCLVLGGLLVLFQGYESIVSQSLQGFEDFRSVALINAVRAILTLAICVPMAYFLGVKGAILGVAAVAVCVLPQSYSRLRRNKRRDHLPARTSLREAMREWPILWHFALPGFLTLVVISSVNWLGRMLLTRIGGGFASVGLLDAASQWMNLAFMVPTMMAGVVLPILSESHGRNAASEYRHALSLQIKAVMMVSLPITIALIGFSRLIAALYGAKYHGADELLPLVVVAGFFHTFNMALRVNYESKARQWTNLSFNGLWAVILLVAAVLLVPRAGVFGYAVAMLISECLLLLITTVHLSLCVLPAFVRPHLPHFAGCLGLLVLVRLGGVYLDDIPRYALTILLSFVASLPVLKKARESGIHRRIRKEITARMLRGNT